MKISNYIFLSSLLLLLPLTTMAHESDKNDTPKKENIFAFKGFNVSADLFGCIYRLFGSSISGEASIDANIGHWLFPVVEVGYGSINTVSEKNGIHYSSAAPYYRVGLNYNFLHKWGGKPADSYPYIAARFGWTNVRYNVDAPPITDPVWGNEVPLTITGAKGTCYWAELGVGVNVKIWRGLRMGWSVRYKMRIKDTSAPNSNIGYVPGYGNNSRNTFGGTYSLIYEIPINRKKQ